MIIIAAWVIFGFITAMIAGNKGKNQALAFVGGMIFGPLAVLYYLCMSNEKRDIEHFIIVNGREAYAKKIADEEQAKIDRRPSVIRWRIGVALFIAAFALFIKIQA